MAYLNGNLYWTRVKSPSTGKFVPLSCGTNNKALAELIETMVADLVSNRRNADLDQLTAKTGRVKLIDYYNAKACDKLNVLLVDATARAEAPTDRDLEPLVQTWFEEYLPGTKAKSEQTRKGYLSSVRLLIPQGTPFYASSFTQRTIVKRLGEIGGADGTRRQYWSAWSLFHDFAKTEVPGLNNPFTNAKTLKPDKGKPRNVRWTFAQTQAVLSVMTGQHKIAMTLCLGSGIELAALLALNVRDVCVASGKRLIQLPGEKKLKNGARTGRKIYVDAWAWPVVAAHAASQPAGGSLWSWEGDNSDQLRDAFYEAQLALGMIGEPVKREYHKKEWGTVAGKHTIHDCRHTWAITRRFGLDGEPPREDQFIWENLGHTDSQMLNQIYAKLNGEEKVELDKERAAGQERIERALALMDGGKTKLKLA